MTTIISCAGCYKQFSSKSQLFRHLEHSAKSCLSPEEYAEYEANVLSKKREKIGVLYGYLPGTDYLFVDNRHETASTSSLVGIEGGQHAAWLVTQAIDQVTHGLDASIRCPQSWSANAASKSKINRSYGSTSRESEAVEQDHHTAALTEVLCTTALPLFVDEELGDTITQIKIKTHAWVSSVNEQLDRMLADMTTMSTSSSISDFQEWTPGRIRVFGRVSIPQKKFNAETDVTHRRVDYCFPADLLYASSRESLSQSALQINALSHQGFCDSLPSFRPTLNPRKPKSVVDDDDDDDDDDDNIEDEQSRRMHANTLSYFLSMKQIMKRISTDADALLEKECHDAKRNKTKTTEKQGSSTADQTIDADEEPPGRPLSKRLLKRKRYHNFCPKILAHDFLAYRRVNRIYHRATLRPNCSSKSMMINNRPFIVISFTGDLFLQEQVVRLIGLLIAICRGVIDDDIIECMFDEEYTNLVPAPKAPSFGLVSGEASYMMWEGKMKTILNARVTDRYSFGWNDEQVVAAVEQWEQIVLHDICCSWYAKGETEDGRLNEETEWLDDVLYPWAARTQDLLLDYRKWKSSTATNLRHVFPSLLESINTSVPRLFEETLYFLRQADCSGMWPSTTPNRQLVMLSTSNQESRVQALSVAHMRAKKNSDLRTTSAYSFKEGEGGASGSFSVGFMPGDQCNQPKANTLFPELVKAAFQLEMALCPGREPSSTIAINRNAQFRPHTDNGAGAGQSTSLIVGLGDYVGGELMVEGVKKDIRYKAVEFDGWKQRHWTLPFQGERYSLVWFTPKGCEGVRGIDMKV